VLLTRAFTGLPTSMLLPAIRRAGLDPATLDETVSAPTAAQLWGGKSHQGADGGESDGPKRWRDIWSAGHSVSGVRAVQSVDALVAEVEQEFHRTGI
jgi:nitronate monooxygenase